MDYVFTEEDAKKVILSLTAYDFLDAVQNDHPQHPEEIKSRYDYNKYVFKYESLFSVIPLEIIIETSYYQSVYPVDKHVVGSFVGRFCLDRNIILTTYSNSSKYPHGREVNFCADNSRVNYIARYLL